MVSRNRAVSFILNVGGRLDGSARRAFTDAGKLASRLDKRMDAAFSTRPIDRATRSVKRMNVELGKTQSQLGRVRTQIGRGFVAAAQNIGGQLGGLAGGLPGVGALGGLGPAGIAAGAGIGVGVLGYQVGRGAQQRAQRIQRASLFAGTDAENVQRLANLSIASGAIEGGDETQALERSADLIREANIRLGDAIRDGGNLAEQFQKIGVGAEGLQQLQTGFQESPVEAINALLDATEGLANAERTFVLDELFGGQGSEIVNIMANLTEQQRAFAEATANRRPIITSEEVANLTQAEMEVQRLGANFANLRQGIGGFISRGLIQPTAIALNEWFKLLPSSGGGQSQAAGGERQSIDLTLNVVTDGQTDGDTVGEAAGREIFDAISSTGGL